MKDVKNIEDKLWKELTEDERKDIEGQAIKMRANSQEIINLYNFILYKWFFILNAGGLIATITLLSTVKNSQNSHGIIILCITLGFIFVAGILSIIIATKLEIKRFDLDQSYTSKELEFYKENKIKTGYFIEKIKQDNFPISLIYFFEYGGIVLFIVGAGIALVYYIMKSLG